jgi:hypothetical protein
MTEGAMDATDLAFAKDATAEMKVVVHRDLLWHDRHA